MNAPRLKLKMCVPLDVWPSGKMTSGSRSSFDCSIEFWRSIMLCTMRSIASLSFERSMISALSTLQIDPMIGKFLFSAALMTENRPSYAMIHGSMQVT